MPVVNTSYSVSEEGRPLIGMTFHGLTFTLSPAQVSELQANLKNAMIQAAIAAAEHQRQNPEKLQEITPIADLPPSPYLGCGCGVGGGIVTENL